MEILGQSTKTTIPLPYTHLGYVAASSRESSWMPLIPGVLLLIVGVLQLRFRKERHRKASIAAIITGLVFLTMAFSMYLDESPITPSMKSSINLKGLVTAIMVYANDADDSLPSSGQWCDLLMAEVDVSFEGFNFLKKEKGESCYAMNKYIVGMKLSDIPDDVVLLFETGLGIGIKRNGSLLSRPFAKELGYTQDKKIFTERWNQVGGPEDIKTDYHKTPGANIVFAGGKTAFIPANEIDSLKWTVEESETPVEAAQTK